MYPVMCVSGGYISGYEYERSRTAVRALRGPRQTRRQGVIESGPADYLSWKDGGSPRGGDRVVGRGAVGRARILRIKETAPAARARCLPSSSRGVDGGARCCRGIAPPGGAHGCHMKMVSPLLIGSRGGDAIVVL